MRKRFKGWKSEGGIASENAGSGNADAVLLVDGGGERRVIIVIDMVAQHFNALGCGSKILNMIRFGLLDECVFCLDSDLFKIKTFNDIFLKARGSKYFFRK